MDEQTVQEELRRLKAAAEKLQREVDALTQKLAAEKKTASAAATVQPPPVAAPKPSSPQPSPKTAAPQPAAGSPFAAPKPAVKPAGLKELEAAFGGKWLNWIGAVTALFAAGFFLKYAFDQGWFSDWVKVGIGFFFGSAGLFLGRRFHKRGLALFAQGLFGGGFAVIYLSVFAAFNLYHLIGQLTAFLGFCLITLAAVFLAVRTNAQAVASLAMLGGFLTPSFVSTGADNQTGLFSYILLLDAGLFAVSLLRPWLWLRPASFFGTLLIFFGWMAGYYAPEKFWSTEAFLTLFFLFFTGVTVYEPLVRRKPGWPANLPISAAAFALYFGTTYQLAQAAHRDWLGLFALLLSFLFAFLAYAVHRRCKEARQETAKLAGSALISLILAVPLQFDGEIVTIYWTAQAILLAYFGLRFDSFGTRVFSKALGFLTLIRLFYFDILPNRYLEGLPFLNERAYPVLAVIAGTALLAWLYVRYADKTRLSEKVEPDLYLVAAAFLTVVLFGLELDGRWVTAFWFLEAAALVFLCWKFKRASLQGAGFFVYAAAVLQLITRDMTLESAPIFFNPRGYISLLAVTGSFFWAYAAKKGMLFEWGQRLFNVFILAGTVIALWFLSYEVWYGVAKAESASQEQIYMARQFGLSILWALYGVAMLVIGFTKRYAPLRLFGLGLLALTIVKVFMADLANLRAIYRILSFFGLSLLLFGASLLYNKYKSKLFGTEPPGGPSSTL